MDSLVTMKRNISNILFFGALITLCHSSVGAASSQNIDYLYAVQQELTRLGFTPTCNTASDRCTTPVEQGPSFPDIDLTVRYSKETDTIYIGFDRFVVLDTDIAPSLALTLLRLNHEMVSAKFSWNSDTLAIQLSASINTDTNFDRRAFRSQITGLLEIAKRIRPTLVSTNSAETVPEKKQISAPTPIRHEKSH